MNFGVIGTNFVSDFFMNGLKQVEGAKVSAVCSRTLENAQKFAEKYTIEHVFTSYEEMLKENIIDAAYVAVPNSLHFEVASYFLKNKIPVFCEKPLTSNFNEAKALITIAKENNTYLQEGLIPLYNPNYQILKENLHKVGRIHQVNLNFSKYSSRYDAYLRGENPTTFRCELSNGATMDLGVYLVAFCIGLFGEPNSILSSASLLDAKADVSGASIFTYDDFIVNLAYSKASDTENQCEICGEKGLLTIDYPSQPKTILFKDRLNKTTEDLSVEVKENFYYEIKEMMKQLNNNKIESEKLPFETILIIHKVLTEMRRQSSIVFPSDKLEKTETK